MAVFIRYRRWVAANLKLYSVCAGLFVAGVVIGVSYLWSWDNNPAIFLRLVAGAFVGALIGFLNYYAPQNRRTRDELMVRDET